MTLRIWRYRRSITALALLASLVLAGLVTGFITVHGWSDISIGTNTDYVSVYRLVHWHWQAGR
jgi:hypothetical protein